MYIDIIYIHLYNFLNYIEILVNYIIFKNKYRPTYKKAPKKKNQRHQKTLLY